MKSIIFTKTILLIQTNLFGELDNLQITLYRCKFINHKKSAYFCMEFGPVPSCFLKSLLIS